MDIPQSSLSDLPPKEYWEDSRWAHAHMAEIAEEYPNLWVAIVDKKVVAAGKVIAEVERIAEEKTGRKDFPLVLAERGIHVYKDQAGIRNQN